ncbi:hypothetical protein NP493_26g06005 [Ridgeia piscesae]|uniref:Membrane-spanning 4-domains subfamily A member 4A-like n=1 Tax=Ridgeia piscesae TaxID=27915 RepID=A0AAD9PDA2_RIDPI|nr:hypothetical protein NP493_26g06005 [Ridgeia piscesae]
MMQTTDNVRSPIWKNYAKKTSMLLGVAQIVIGVLCIGFHIAVIVDVTPTAKIGQGIWGGLFFIATGAFGVVAGKQRTTRSIVSFMILSILSATVFATLVLSLSFVGFFRDQIPYGGDIKSYAVAAHFMMMILSLVEFVVAIASSAICCAAVCCGSSPQSGIDKRQIEMGHVAVAAPRPYGQPSHQGGDGAADSPVSVSQFAEHEKLFAA